MVNTKVSLTMLLRGGTMLSEQECSKQLKEPILVERGKYKGKQRKDKDGNPMFKVRTVPDPEKVQHHEIRLTDKNNKLTEVLNYYTRGYSTAKQVLNICEEAYTYFVSTEAPEGYRAPNDFKPSKTLLKKGVSKTKQAWMAMSKEQRLKWHLVRICESRGGRLGEYTVFND